jgi:nucleoside-diphosphate-sugar epimerase
MHYSFGTPVSIVRPFNTYGPRQSARALIPAVIIQIAGGLRDIKLGSLHPTRDFNFIKDTVEGFIAAAESSQSTGEVINLGSNYEITVGDTVHLIADIMGKEITIQTEEARIRPEKSEVERLWADNTRAKQLLGWKPGYGGLEGLKKGLLETINWFQDPGNLKQYKEGIYNI